MFDVQTIPIEKITVSERARKEIGDLEGLKHSIGKFGVLNAILIDENHQLIAGERRLKACQELELTEVPARILPGLSPDDHFLIEFIENYDRKDFTWVEELELKAKMHAYWKNTQGQWGYRETAAKLNVSLGGLSSDLALAEAISYFPELREAKTKGKARDAYKRLQSNADAIVAINSLSDEEQAKIAQMMERTEKVVKDKKDAAASDDAAIPSVKHPDLPPQYQRAATPSAAVDDPAAEPDDMPEFTYRVCTFKEFLPQVPANIVGFAELDPPYAINYDYAYHNDTEEDADWSLEDLEDGLDTIFSELQRVMMDDSWVLCWTGYEHILWIQELALEKGFHIQHPGVWVKPNGGRTNTPSVIMKSAHEHFLLFRKGKAMFNTPSFSNVVVCETTSGERIHKWEKPIDLYRKFFQALHKPGSYFLSPFAGSGNAMITATFFDMIPIGCEISNKYFYQFYRRLKNFYMEN